ncbi:MAG: beta-ketoacyl-[acyl-carrier-protein] synthase II, partial [Gammaproteobacteria bacterium]|nr:beta-ketoacyl-[acyl-carrier-protein] synthase II [Gammaproteobacteria bacterium]
MPERVFVTAVGVVSPCGADYRSTWEAVCAGRSGIGPVSAFDASALRSQIAGEAKDFDPLDYMPAGKARRRDRFVQLALAASAQAVGETGLPDSYGTLVGSGAGGFLSAEEHWRRLESHGAGRASPYMMPRVLANMAAAEVAIEFGLKGPCLSVNTACATGTNAIGEGFRLIRDGYLQGVLCGAAEAPISLSFMAGF